MKSDIKKSESEHLAILNEQEADINHGISEIAQSIGELEKFLDSNYGCLLSKYKSRNAEFRKLPPKLIVTPQSFSFQRIDTEQLIQQFSSLSALSISTEERLSIIISSPQSPYRFAGEYVSVEEGEKVDDEQKGEEKNRPISHKKKRRKKKYKAVNDDVQQNHICRIYSNSGTSFLICC